VQITFFSLSPPFKIEDFIVIRKISLALALMTVTGVASAAPSGNSETCFQLVPWLQPICIPAFPSRPSQPTRTQAPEIDPASAMAGLTMLAGGIAILRGRRRIKIK
jgi:hypothetical protein